MGALAVGGVALALVVRGPLLVLVIAGVVVAASAGLFGLLALLGDAAGNLPGAPLEVARERQRYYAREGRRRVTRDDEET